MLSVPGSANDTDTPSVTATHSPNSVHIVTPFSAASSTLSTSSAQDDVLHAPLNMRHMELFSHFLLDTGPSLAHDQVFDREHVRLMMPAILSAPWLMHQVLALSAMHLSCIRPTEAKRYREEATHLQMQALSLSSDSVKSISRDNCEAMLIFASLLGLHTLAEAVITSENDADGFLDRFVTYLNLHRGVRAITLQAWGYLTQSNLSPFLDRAEQSFVATRLQTQGQATVVSDYLSSLLDQADLNSEAEAACRDAVCHLQLIYQVESLKGQSSAEEQRHMGSLVSSWPVLLSVTFTDLLKKRRTEALVILCYYAVLLHRRRSTWFVGNAGRMLIEAITKFLGTYWKHWLDWPNQMLEGS